VLCHQREALNVGLKYLDANSSGFIEPTDIPTLSVSAFTALDKDGDQKISPQELQTFLDQTTSKIREKELKLVALKEKKEKAKSNACSSMVEASVNYGSDAEQIHQQITSLTTDIRQLKNMLNQVYSVFHKGFSENVYGRVGMTEEEAEAVIGGEAEAGAEGKAGVEEVVGREGVSVGQFQQLSQIILQSPEYRWKQHQIHIMASSSTSTPLTPSLAQQ